APLPPRDRAARPALPFRRGLGALPPPGGQVARAAEPGRLQLRGGRDHQRRQERPPRYRAPGVGPGALLTIPRRPPYSDGPIRAAITMTDTLHQLERKIDRLIALCEQLHADNHRLRERESALLRERSQLLEKNELARSRVEAMISRLKSLDIET